MTTHDWKDGLRHLRSGTQHGIKTGVERALGERLWISPASTEARVRNLIERLQPRRTKRPLFLAGPNADGGYLIPDDLDGVDYLLSPGVSFEAGFDLEMASRGMEVLLIDASVQAPPMMHENFRFVPKFVGSRTAGIFARLEDLCAEHLPAAVTAEKMLQIDIEGAEYQVLADMSSDFLSTARIMIIEFHDLQHMFSRFALPMIEAIFDKILRTHGVAHVHANNCCGAVTRHGLTIPRVLEITFVRSDRMDPSGDPMPLPHPLDVVNVTRNPPLQMQGAWVGG